MLKAFKIYQDHAPNGVAAMYFGGVVHRVASILKEGMSYEKLVEAIYEKGECSTIGSKYYTNLINMKMMGIQAKQYNMYFIVNNTTQWNDPDISYDLYGKACGAIADKLQADGFSKGQAAIALMNEPGKSQFCGNGTPGAIIYVQYCWAANRYVKGRYPLIFVNDEYHLIDEKYIFENTKNIPDRIFGVHHLSSLGKSPAWQNVRDAKTQANEWGVPVICDEGGSWFAKYQSEQGHAVNVKLLEECKKYDYLGCAIVCVDNNEYTYAHTYGQLGYRIWTNDYSRIVNDLGWWKKFEEVLKIYWKEEQPMPEERDLKVIPGYMQGPDVALVQNKLREIGFDLKVDAWYGSITEAAVKKFQELIGLTSNGIVNANTREMLEASSVETFYPEVFQNIYESKNYSIEAIDYYLDTFGHPDVHGHGKYFVQAEQETKIPAEWQLANGSAESSFKGGGIGSSPIAQKYNNLFGYGIPDSGPTAEGNFKSFAECIPYVAKEIKRLFLNKDNWRYHGDHIFGIEVRYSTACYNAINKANQYRKICKFLDAGIRYKVPEYMDKLIEKLDERYAKK